MIATWARGAARSTAAALALPILLTAVLAGLAGAAEEGPFSGFAGSWSGTGTVSISNGTNERIRCRAKYSVAPSGANLHQELRCASDSYKFEVNSNVIAGPQGSLSGTWTELTRQVTGAVSGKVMPGSIDVAVKGPVFSATLAVETKGDKQSVAIRPTGTDIEAITIEMKRG